MGFEGFWSGQAGKTEVKYDGVYMREITESQLRYISGAEVRQRLQLMLQVLQLLLELSPEYLVVHLGL